MHERTRKGAGPGPGLRAVHRGRRTRGARADGTVPPIRQRRAGPWTLEAGPDSRRVQVLYFIHPFTFSFIYSKILSPVSETNTAAQTTSISTREPNQALINAVRRVPRHARARRWRLTVNTNARLVYGSNECLLQVITERVINIIVIIGVIKQHAAYLCT